MRVISGELILGGIKNAYLGEQFTGEREYAVEHVHSIHQVHRFPVPKKGSGDNEPGLKVNKYDWDNGVVAFGK